MGYIINIPNDNVDVNNRYIVYQILFPNNKRYIGCTSATLTKRINDHISAMESGLNYKIYNAMRKYGVNNLKFEILGKYKTKEEMFIKEKYFINLFNSQLNGYNTTLGGEGCPGRIISEEERIKISNGQKNRFSKESERLKYSIIKKEWNKNNPIQLEEMNKRKLEILKSDKHRNFMSKKMKEVYFNNPDIKEKTKQSLKNLYKENLHKCISQSKKNGGKPIEVYKNNEHVATFHSLSATVKELKLNLGNVGLVLDGVRNQSGGYVFKRGEWNENTKLFNNISNNLQ